MSASGAGAQAAEGKSTGGEAAPAPLLPTDMPAMAEDIPVSEPAAADSHTASEAWSEASGACSSASGPTWRLDRPAAVD